jgi:hypothetical protein
LDKPNFFSTTINFIFCEVNILVKEIFEDRINVDYKKELDLLEKEKLALAYCLVELVDIEMFLKYFEENFKIK